MRRARGTDLRTLLRPHGAGRAGQDTCDLGGSCRHPPYARGGPSHSDKWNGMLHVQCTVQAVVLMHDVCGSSGTLREQMLACQCVHVATWLAVAMYTR